jgi:catecholate siderophore receptor
MKSERAAAAAPAVGGFRRKNMKLPRIVVPLAGCWMLAGFGSTAVADGPAAPAPVQINPVEVSSPRLHDDDFRSPSSTVGGKFPTDTRDIPQQVTVINQAVMQSQGVDSLYRALDNVPGIVITPSADTATGNNINLRGFPARTDIYLDGVRDRGQYYRDVFALEDIEVLEGAASLLFGHGSTGGIINQVSKKPQLQPIGDVSIALGSDSYYRGTADVDQALDQQTAFRLNLMGQSVDATRSSVLNSEDYGVAPSIAFGIGTPTEVTLSLLSQHNSDHVDYGFPMFQFQNDAILEPMKAPFDRTYQYTDSLVRTDVNIPAISIVHRFSPNLEVRNNTQYGSYNVNQDTSPLNTAFVSFNAQGQYAPVPPATFPGPPITPLDQLEVAAQQKQRSAHDSSLFNQTDVLIHFATGFIKHELVVGAEFGRDEYDQTFYNNYNFNLNNGAGLGVNLPGAINLGSSNTQTFPTGANIDTAPGNITSLDADTIAPYFNDTLSFGEHWKLVAGLRWDQFSASQTYTLYTYPNLVTSNADPAQTAVVQATNAAVLASPTISSLPFQHADYEFSPRAGVIWQPTDWQSYYLSYSTAFNPQAIEGAATTGQLPTSTAQIQSFINGGGLKPEETRVYETGGKLDLLARQLSVSTAVFEEDKYRTRFTDPDTGNIGVNGKERVRGAELKLVGQIARNWQALAAYTWLDGKIVSSPIPLAAGQTLPELAKNSASLWTTYDFRSGGVPANGFWSGYWQIGGGLKFSSRQYAVNSPYTLYGSAPGYTRLDATAAYIAHQWDVRLNLENLADRDYYAAVNAGRAIPGDGLRAVLTTTYHFY